jgi:threonine synthase
MVLLVLCRIGSSSIATEEMDDASLGAILNTAFESKGFPDPLIPVVKKIPGIYVAELYHGPTYCFKDLGMRTLVNFLGHFATCRKTKITLIAATTGDTGPAAVQAIQDLPEEHRPYMSILVHYPQGQISEFQRKQLTTLQSDKIQVVAFQGGGDDMDVPIKNIQQQPSLNKKQGDARITCGINSYNIGRPLMQMVHFIWTYLRVAEDLKLEVGDPNCKVDIVVPTGAMGNLVGGYMAKCMGVPLGTFCAGVNINDVTHTVIQTGNFYRKDVMHMTLSEAINIQMVRGRRPQGGSS